MPNWFYLLHLNLNVIIGKNVKCAINTSDWFVCCVYHVINTQLRNSCRKKRMFIMDDWYRPFSLYLRTCVHRSKKNSIWHDIPIRINLTCYFLFLFQKSNQWISALIEKKQSVCEREEKSIEKKYLKEKTRWKHSK